MPDNTTNTLGADVVYRDELREFMVVLRRALLMIVRWIEKRYELHGGRDGTV